MTTKDKQWLKENEPWTYDDLYSDPVGIGDTGSGCGEFLLIVLIALGVGSLLFYLFGAK